MSNVLTDEARYKAGKSQMGTFLSNQFYKSHLILFLAVCQILYQMAWYYFFSLVRQYSGRSSDHGSSFFNSSSLGKAPIFLSSSNI